MRHVRRTKPASWSPYMDGVLRKFWPVAGIRAAEIADKIGLTEGQIEHRAVALKLGPRPGQAAFQRAIRDKQFGPHHAEIKAMYEAGSPLSHIAARYKACAQVMNHWLRDHSREWDHAGRKIAQFRAPKCNSDKGVPTNRGKDGDDNPGKACRHLLERLRAAHPAGHINWNPKGHLHPFLRLTPPPRRSLTGNAAERCAA